MAAGLLHLKLEGTAWCLLRICIMTEIATIVLLSALLKESQSGRCVKSQHKGNKSTSSNNYDKQSDDDNDCYFLHATWQLWLRKLPRRRSSSLAARGQIYILNGKDFPQIGLFHNSGTTRTCPLNSSRLGCKRRLGFRSYLAP